METARGDAAVGSSKALHPSDEGEGREGGPRERRELCYGGREGRILYELLLFCQSYVRLDCLPRAECGRPVVGKSAETLKWEKK